MKQKRKLTIEDLGRVEYLSAPHLAPDGLEAVIVRTQANRETGLFIPGLLKLKKEGEAWGEPEALFSEYEADKPRYSPDGRFLAFRVKEGETATLCLLNRETGEMNRPLTLRYGVEDFSWAPDSRSLAFQAPLIPGEEAKVFEAETKEEREIRLRKAENEPIVIEELMYKLDEWYGLKGPFYSHIGVYHMETGEKRMITSGPVEYESPAWSPDSLRLAFFGRPFKDAKARRCALFTASPDGSGLEALTGEDDLIIPSSPPAYSLFGDTIVYIGYLEEDGVYSTTLFEKPLDGTEAKRFIEDRQGCHVIGGAANSRTFCGDLNPAFAIGQDGELWFVASENGNNAVYHMPPGKGRAHQESPPFGSVHSFAPPLGNTLLYTRGAPMMIAELFSLDLSTGEETRLTHSNQWLKDVALSEPKEMRVKTKDGKAKIHGFVLAPPDAEPGKTYPAVLDIHGGPEVSYGRDFWFEFHYFAAMGLSVIWCDPRGSAGYGPEFQGGGENAMDDLLSFLEKAASERFIDREAIGVTGGSYGGLMTTRLITQTKRFKAAAAQRVLCNLTTSYGTGDMGFVQGNKNFSTMLKMMLDRAKSPATTIKGVDNIDIPLLILHGYKDYRCGFEQAEQLFIATKERRPDLPVRLIAFPKENHSITRTGSLKAQEVHLDEMARWFVRYLNGEEETNG